MNQKPKLKWIIAAVFGLGILALLKSFIHVGARAGYFADDNKFATAAVERFHSQYNAGQYQAIYDEATPDFKNGVSQSAFTAAIVRSKQNYGIVVKSDRVGANAFPGGQVRFVYNTRFLNIATIETFIWQSDGQKASLVRYQVSPGTAQPITQFQP